MIGTHAPKIFNSRLKQSAVCSEIAYKPPKDLICSKNIKLTRKVWALPRSAAEMARYREVIASKKFVFESSLPKIEDPALKQVLLPLNNWEKDGYVSVSPVASCGLIHEMWLRLFDKKLPFKSCTIQPTPVAIANHGETLLMQSGKVRLLKRGIAKFGKSITWKGDFIQLTARVEGMNMTSGMLAAGWPALTAIGGVVHTLERESRQEIEFAFGMSESSWDLGVHKITVLKGKKPIPSYSTEERTATNEIVLLLRTNGDFSLILEALKKIHRFAGGQIFDAQVTICKNESPARASYLIDASHDVSRLISSGKAEDTLDAALQMYGKDGKWQNGRWFQYANGYTLNMSGYAYLESPKKRLKARNNGLHAWAEPVFSLVTQGRMSDLVWWKRSDSEWGHSWHGVDR